MHKQLKKVAVGIAALAALALGGGAIAQAGSSGDGAKGDQGQDRPGAPENDRSVTGSGADKAKAAALRITDGGHANAVERDSENGATWEVEVTKPNGKTVDVRLDQNYKLVVVESDSEG